MKINEPSRVGGINHYRKANEAKAAEVKKGKQKDEVQISPEAQEMLNATRGSVKLDELKQAVSAGTYQVDSRKLAEKLWPYVK